MPDLVRRRAVAAIDSHQLARLCWWHNESRRLMGLFTAADGDPKQSRRILMMPSVASDRFDRLGAKDGLSPADRDSRVIYRKRDAGRKPSS